MGKWIDLRAGGNILLLGFETKNLISSPEIPLRGVDVPSGVMTFDLLFYLHLSLPKWPNS